MDYQQYPILLMPFRPLRGYFYLYLHSTLILQTIISYCIPPTFVRLRITSIRLRLRSPSFPGLISRTSTSLRFVRPRCFDISLFQLAFYQFRSDLVRSFVIYIGLRIQTHPLIYIHYPIIFGSDIDHISLYYTLLAIQELFTQNYALLGCLWCLCWFWSIQTSLAYQRHSGQSSSNN